MVFKDNVLILALVAILFSRGIVLGILTETIMRNISAKLFRFWASGSGDVF